MENASSLLYKRLAQLYLSAITAGTLKPGARMPSVRKIMAQHSVSLSTALQMCRYLETQGHLEARPRSGYFVRTQTAGAKRLQLAAMTEPMQGVPIDPAQYVGIHQRVSSIVAQGQRPLKVNLARATGASDLYPETELRNLALRTLRKNPVLLTKAIGPGGNQQLKNALVQRAMEYGIQAAPDEAIITYGCIEALNLALRAVAQAGDVIAVESPTFYGLLQVLESQGLKALEIPTSPQTGISLEALELALQTYENIKAVVVIPHLQNPLGSIMPDLHKQRLVSLCEASHLPIIEDDSYAALVDAASIPTAIKHWDQTGNVIYCASLHKILAPGMRVGWMLAGRWHARVTMLKYAQTRYNEELPQMVISEFIASSAYDRHLRKLRATLRLQREQTAEAIAEYFPVGTRMNMPRGGVAIWVELAQQVSSKLVFEQALEHGILISPGLLYSNSNRFNHFIRLNCGMHFTPELEQVYRTLGQILHGLEKNLASSQA